MSDIGRRSRSLAVSSAGLLRPYGHPIAFLAGIAAASTATILARKPIEQALDTLGRQRPLPLGIAVVCALLVPLLTAGAWRSALHSRREALSFRDAWGCYGAGSLANSVLPGGAGEAVRIESFARRLGNPRRRLLACGTSAAIALSQTLVLSVVLAAGVAAGALPLWALAPALGLPVAIAAARLVVARRQGDGRLRQAAAVVGFSSAAWARLLAWLVGSALLRLLAVAAVLDALAAPHPLTSAVVAIGARALGNAIPLAPGSVGLPAAAMAVGLHRAGVANATAVAAALSFHALETGAALMVGIAGFVLLRLGPARHDHAHERVLGALPEAAVSAG